MITALVKFTLAEPMSEERMAEAALATVPLHEGMDGLIRKYWLSTNGGSTVGGIYLWESQVAADAVYISAWRERTTAAYGSAPTVTFFETPVVLDNRHHATIS